MSLFHHKSSSSLTNWNFGFCTECAYIWRVIFLSFGRGRIDKFETFLSWVVVNPALSINNCSTSWCANRSDSSSITLLRWLEPSWSHLFIRANMTRLFTCSKINADHVHHVAKFAIPILDSPFFVFWRLLYFLRIAKNVREIIVQFYHFGSRHFS